MFERVSLPTPFQVGPVNAYLAGRTLVDPGPDSEEAWADLLDALDARDLGPGDIEQVLITHPHPDHFGAAHRFRENGARVVASRRATPIIEDFPGRLEYEQSFFRDFFERCGMDQTTAKTVTNLPEAYVEYAPSVGVDEQVDAGDTLVVADTTVTVDTVDGHAEGEVIFAYEHGGERTAVVGDNVLDEITPNPLLLPPREPGGPRPHVLPAYNRSLDRLRGEGYDRFLPGHRGRVEDPGARIEAIRDSHEQRTERVAELLEQPMTPVDVMHELFGDLPATEAFPGMSEAVGHLDVLRARDRVRTRERGGLVVYERR
ncbi:MBL fold metallo-hydrolase [Halapricum salinum]|uniref:MBL fold metallo-hydrolase n=1 Tax=Halapricum salinum TaxID=1457250 RepID=A0A4D6H7I5_9EURY|nr:MBL fold metallo-hydrolase [Halapricum salinum]QCC49763.1 MBL fold metallo-hydrolase [Halapricum salinum]